MSVPAAIARRGLLLTAAAIALAAAALVQDVRAARLAANTLLLAGGVAAIALAIGTPLALLLARSDARGRRPAAALLASGLFVPPLVYAGAWQAAFGRDGWLILAVGSRPVAGWAAAIGAHALAAIPWVVLVVAVSLVHVEPELEEAALLDAAPWRVLWRVTLVRARAALVAAAVLAVLLVSADMSITNVFLVRTYAEEVYTQIALGGEPGQSPWRLAPAIAAQGLLVCLAAAVAWQVRPRRGRAPRRRASIYGLGRWRWPLSIALWLAIALVVLVPWGSLAYEAGTIVARAEGGFVRRWSPVKCAALVVGSYWRDGREFAATAQIALAATALAGAVALPLAWWARRGGWQSTPALAASAAAWATPGPLVGLAIIGLLNQPALPPLTYLYDETILAPALAQAVRALPATILVLAHALASVPPAWLEQAELEGAGPLARLLGVGLATRKRALVAALVVTFALAAGDLAATILVLPPAVTTVPWQVFSLLHAGVDDRAAALCLASSLAAAALALVAMRLLRIR